MARRSAEKEAFWRLVLEEHLASGLSVRAFCKQEAVSEASFYAWRRELGARDRREADREGRHSQQSHSQQPAMIPVSIVDDNAPPVRPVLPSANCSLEVSTPSGFTLRFNDQLDPGRLRVLLHAIASSGNGDSSC